MSSYIGALIVGVICIILGISNMRGNISSLHRYHRHRVAEEDRVPFGKAVGCGTVICGVALMAFGVLSGIAEKSTDKAITFVGTAILALGLAIGLGITFWAMIKYNKGIF